MVFALHNEDPVSSTSLKQHVLRGTKAILLMNKMDRRASDDEGLVEYIMTARNVRNQYQPLMHVQFYSHSPTLFSISNLFICQT